MATYQLSAPQLDQLLSPIALYPDPLVGTMLPASTHPDQIAAAASFMANNPDPSQIDQQPWDDSVKVLAHYPDVLNWMAQNPAWTSQLGNAVAQQEPQVMDSIQRLRTNARAAGMLVDTPQQRVIVQNNIISILPAQPGTIYVPSYDPQYVESGVSGGVAPPIDFGIGYPLAGFATFGLDWLSHSVWIDHSHDRENERGRFTDRGSRQIWRPAEPREDHERMAVGPGRVVRPSPMQQRRDYRRQITPTGRPNERVMERRGRPEDRDSHPEYSRSPQSTQSSRDQERGDRDRDRTDRDDRPRGD